MGRTILADAVLGTSDKKAQTGPLMESTKRKTLIDRNEVTVINTADILGPSLENSKRAREALRSLQLASPGPHAFLLVIQAPSLSTGNMQSAAEAIQATRKLFGDEALRYILPVLTHTGDEGQTQTVEKLLKDESLRRALSLCNQTPEVVESRPEQPLEELRMARRQLLDRVTEMKTLRGHFVHELQRRENQRREELLVEMTSALERKLGHM